jgi:hypothetical protein
MAKDRRGYYYRKRKVNGKVISDYVGKGPIADLFVLADAQIAENRREAKRAWQAEKDEMEAIDQSLEELNRRIDLLARATLVAAGYHQHHRSEWRKKRNGRP